MLPRTDDLFMFFRSILAWLVTIYFTIVTVQWLWDQYKQYLWLKEQKYGSQVKLYLMVLGLRTRLRRFWGDVLVCILLFVAFLLLWHAQTIMDRIEFTLTPKVYHAGRAVQHS